MLHRPTKRRSRTEWAQLMTDYEAGSLTQRAFCTEHELAYSSFCYWRKQLRELAEVQTPALIELPVSTTPATPSWRIEIELGAGMIVRIR